MNTPVTSGIDRIDLMQTFVRIVESGSLSAAAAQLSTSQPTVSRRLQSLERLLGAKLILRTTHAMKLTDDGQRCYEQAKLLLERWVSLEDQLSGAGDEPVGILRVRAPHAFGQDQLIAPLTRYLQRYPNLSVDWMLNDRTPDFISEDIDCAIQVGNVADPSLVAILLAEVPRIVVATPQLLQRHPVSQVSELSQLPWISFSTYYRNEFTLKHDNDGRMESCSIAPRMATDSLYAMRKAALSGLGAGIVSAWIVKEDIAEGRLQRVLPGWNALPLPVYLVYPYSSYYPARLRKFLEMMRSVMPELAEMQAPGG
ncbi:LysR family transcriptional regulator [Rahnella aquatilis]|uniref:Transcriptional regulator n=1 Tax=Rahnella aquatilis (strain ATCC 33071 / DSM 4594 / JCM 1683 / NBRC 105701 / NCIMB 13365 / CIP 78.65) TaxID=745277 RepID=H2IYP5_RAHAC|nr:LysR family transcriptional regulator [Rahnella aquatilis]AEX52056.1 transcriptional regulator [Rahnella aquatilis CIP 78.65 = ATCC 33071]KFD14129.1 LysR family transcriptional regulator [Rahnella aquatilis CIP 78.65 = ATCC 33071]